MDFHLFLAILIDYRYKAVHLMKVIAHTSTWVVRAEVSFRCSIFIIILFFSPFQRKKWIGKLLNFDAMNNLAISTLFCGIVFMRTYVRAWHYELCVVYCNCENYYELLLLDGTFYIPFLTNYL